MPSINHHTLKTRRRVMSLSGQRRGNARLGSRSSKTDTSSRPGCLPDAEKALSPFQTATRKLPQQTHFRRSISSTQQGKCTVSGGFGRSIFDRSSELRLGRKDRSCCGSATNCEKVLKNEIASRSHLRSQSDPVVCECVCLSKLHSGTGPDNRSRKAL